MRLSKKKYKYKNIKAASECIHSQAYFFSKDFPDIRALKNKDHKKKQ